MITEEQRIQRMNHDGSTDLPAIMGVDPWRTRADVWLDKTGKLEDKPTPVDGKDPRVVGNTMEGGVLDFAERELGPLERNIFMPCPNYPGEPIASNLDAIVIGTGVPVEAKTSGSVFGGEEHTDQIPDHIIIQCQVHIFCSVVDMCHVPALVAKFNHLELNMFEVLRNETLIDLIREADAEFREKYVKTDTPPPDSVPHLEVLKRVRRIPAKVVDVKPELIQQWRDDNEAAKESEKIADESKALVIAALGDAEGSTAGALGSVTYFEQHRKEFVSKACDFRVLRFKKPK